MIESVSTHFIDRIIGESADSSSKRRKGVKMEDVLAVFNSKDVEIGEPEYINGDRRINFTSNGVSVTISTIDKVIIQCNPRKRVKRGKIVFNMSERTKKFLEKYLPQVLEQTI